MNDAEAFNELHETPYYLSFMRGYENYMRSENLSYIEHPQMMDAHSRIYLDAKKQGIICEAEGLDTAEAAKRGEDDGWIAAQVAHRNHESIYRYHALNSEEVYEPLETFDNINEISEDNFESDFLDDIDDFSEDLDENIEDLKKSEMPDTMKVTWDYLRGFLAGYADYLYEKDISIDNNEDLRTLLRTSFVRALNSSDDMFNPLREDGKDKFYPGILDGRRCAALDVEQISPLQAHNSDISSPTGKQTDLLSRTC